MSNIFIIPSWYPSKGNPLNGIFVKEQTLSLAKYYPDLNFGISCWGQNDEDFLVHSAQPIKGVKKLLRKNLVKDICLRENVWELFTPAYSYHQVINKGNIKGKIKACLENLRRFENKFGPVNIIHAHVSYPGGYIANQLRQITGIPYIITEHMAPFPQKYHLTKEGDLKREIKEAITQASTMIAVSNYLKKEIESWGLKKPIITIPNFIDADSHTNKRTKESSIFTFVTVCGMSQGKGVEELLRAIKVALDHDHSLRFIFVGDGPAKEELDFLSKQLSVHKHVQWAGYVPKEEVKKYYEQADAHILCSHHESFGVVYIEAMAMGLPNIAAAIGGPLDIIDKDTGILIEDLQPEQIGKKILWLKENYHLFSCKNIKESFKKRFSVDAVAPQIRRIYTYASKTP